MIAISTNYNDCTLTDTSYYGVWYSTGGSDPIITLSHKEKMKIWAKVRMKLNWYSPIKESIRKSILLKPIELRNVMIGINGWANQH
jgi:hypothetical protein